MCGIAGILTSDNSRKEKIYKMTKALSHRGPDENGHYLDENIAIGQSRLSIIDLSTGRQPMSNETDTLYLICNGEIYNSPELREQLISSGHSFKTSTDVEVILHLYEEYGRDCVKYLQGMFALAVWDKTQKTLFLARDHLGQKPLFFYNNDSFFTFSSEIKGMLQAGLVEPEIDLNGLWHYISLRFIPDQYSLFKNINKLPAGSWLYVEDGKITVKKYWDLDFTKKLPNNESEIEEGLDNLLRKTVKSHLLSDVPLGTFLSGGIDSSTVTAMVAEITGQSIPTFSIGVEEQAFNEIPYAEMVIDKYHLDPHNRKVKADLIHLIPSMIYHMDEPSDPFGVGVYLVAQVARETVKVVLGGDGGDENFAGYDRFAGNRLVDYYCLFPEWFRKSIVKKVIDRIPESFGYKSLAQKATWVNEMSFFTNGARYAQSMSFLRFTQESKQSLFTDVSRNQIDDYDSFSKILKYFDSSNADDLVDRMLYTDLMTRMPDHLLTIVDRMCMAHSLESRSPLIDYKVVEYAASIPGDLKLKGKDLKYILKKVASRYLPKELIYRKKQGFGFPIAIWLRTELADFLKNLFNQSRFVDLGIFNQGYINTLLYEHLEGKKDHNFRLWILLNLEIWYRIYFENENIDSMKEFTDKLMKAA
jgi:asparagine synthase (glutamine-hydrolysing)